MLTKTGPTQRVLPAIANRWSPIYFDDREISTEQISTMLEAAQWAPSSFNEQPWRFLIMNKYSDIGSYSKLLLRLAPFNRQWASSAPILILVATSTNFARNGKLNRHALFDTGQAVANLTTQAMEFGIYSHQMGGVDFDEARKDFELPEEFEIVEVIAFGYLGNNLDLTDEMRKREEVPRSRKPLKEIAFFDKFKHDLERG